MSINEKMTAIADKIRYYCNFTKKLGLDDMADNIDVVYDLGAQNGKDTAYDEFWDSFQQNGARRNYSFGFAGLCWTDSTYNPKYAIIVTKIANSIFSYNTSITSTKVPITVDTANSGSMFLGCSKLAQIPSITVTSKVVFTNCFAGCYSLKDVYFTKDSVIANSINLSECPLSYESIINIIGVLKDFRTVKTYDIEFAAPSQSEILGNFSYGTFFPIGEIIYDANIILVDIDAETRYPFYMNEAIPQELSDATHIAFDSDGESISVKFPAASSTKTITFGQANLNKLSESERLLITEKGWSLA